MNSLTCSCLNRGGVLQVSAPRHYDDRVQSSGYQRSEGALGRRGAGHGQRVDGSTSLLKANQVAVYDTHRWAPGHLQGVRPAAVGDGYLRDRCRG